MAERLPSSPVLEPRRRALTAGEREIARRVFGDALDLDRVRLARRSAGRFAVVIGRTVHLPPGAPRDFASAPLSLQAWLVHELTHVWQFQTRPLRTLLSWLLVALGGGYGPGLPGYRYRLPLKSWDRYNLEQQACLVEHRFLLEAGASCPRAPREATLADYSGVSPFGAKRRESMDIAPDPTEAWKA